jgi:phosphinothricin acetyltransferase
MQVRDAAAEDLAAIQAIYSHHVLSGFGSFETEPPSLAEMRTRYVAVAEAGLPYLVAVTDGQITGYAYANRFRPRAAYRQTVENSVYVGRDSQGRGVGRALLEALIARCATLDLQQMIAVIGDTGNTGSIALHRACGFRHVGTLESVGRKFDRWVDVVLMQRALRPQADRT